MNFSSTVERRYPFKAAAKTIILHSLHRCKHLSEKLPRRKVLKKYATIFFIFSWKSLKFHILLYKQEIYFSFIPLLKHVWLIVFFPMHFSQQNHIADENRWYWFPRKDYDLRRLAQLHEAVYFKRIHIIGAFHGISNWIALHRFKHFLWNSRKLRHIL